MLFFFFSESWQNFIPDKKDQFFFLSYSFKLQKSYSFLVVFGIPHEYSNPPPHGDPGVLKLWIPHPMGPRGFEILNPPPHGGGVLLHKIGPWFQDVYLVDFGVLLCFVLNLWITKFLFLEAQFSLGLNDYLFWFDFDLTKMLDQKIFMLPVFFSFICKKLCW